MDLVAKNLRCFYGINAVKVWSSYRDFQRAERSIAVYSKVVESLKKDLNLENERRGTLVRLRSNEVTAVKGKLSEVEAERNKTLKSKRQKESGIDTFLGRMEIRVKALFGSSASIEKIQEAVDEEEKKSKKLESDIKKIGDELSAAVFKQNAAIDPIEDLEFALEYLDGEIDQCRQRQQESRDYISGHTTKKCMEGGPMILDLFIHSGLQVEDQKSFAELYLKIHEEGMAICSSPLERDSEKPLDVIETVSRGFKSNKVEMKGNVKLSGTGSHHRKVKRGKSRVWRQFSVYFNGTANVRMSFDQQKFNTGSVKEALSENAAHDFHVCRNAEVKKLSLGKEQKLNLLRQNSSMLFEQLIHN